MDSLIGLAFLLILAAIAIYSSFSRLRNQRKTRKSEQMLNKARTEFDLENYSAAASICENAIKEDKQNPYLYHKYGEALFSIKKYKEAVSSFSKAIMINPDYEPSYLSRAFALIQIGGYRKALEDCNQVIKNKEPSSIPFGAHIIKGSVLIHFEKYEKALNEFNLALRLNPGFFLIYTCQAEAYCYLSRFDKASESVKKSFEINPSIDINYLWRGWANFGLKKFDESIEDLNRYLEADKESPKAFEIRGLVYKAKENTDKALMDLEMAANLYKKQKLFSSYEQVCRHIREIKENSIIARSSES